MPPRKKSARRTYSDAERAAALRDYELFGPTWVATNHGIPKQTVDSWAKKDDVRTVHRDVMYEAHNARSLDFKAARQMLLTGLYIDSIKIQAKMWEPSTVYNFGGQDNSYNEHTFNEALPIDQKIRTGMITQNIAAAVKLEAVDSTSGVNEAKSVLMDLAAAFGIGVNNDDNIDEELDGSSGSTDTDAEDAPES